MNFDFFGLKLTRKMQWDFFFGTEEVYAQLLQKEWSLNDVTLILKFLKPQFTSWYGFK